MSAFQEFVKTYGSGENCQPFDPTIREKYENKLPQILLEHWQECGWCSYAQGLIWVANPQSFKSIIKQWFGRKTTYIVIARTVFGQLFVWTGHAIKFVHVHYGGVSEVATDVEFLFNFGLCDRRYLDNGLDRKLFLRAIKKVGPLSPSECFGYEPALSLALLPEVPSWRT